MHSEVTNYKIDYLREIDGISLFNELNLGNTVEFRGHSMFVRQEDTIKVLWVVNPYGLDYPFYPFNLEACSDLASLLSSGDSIGNLAE